MEYLIDSANTESVAYMSQFYPIAGVTTNPSLVAKEKTEFLPLIRKLRAIIGNESALHVQATAKTAEDMIFEAEQIVKAAGGQIYVKIPICEEGLKAAKQLAKKGIGVTMTAVFTAQQALLAARAGACFVAPYVNRLDMINADGAGTVAEIVRLFDRYRLDCRVLAASFKNVRQVAQVALAGAHCATVSPELMKELISHPMTDRAVEGFDSDWRRVYGTKSVKDLLS